MNRIDQLKNLLLENPDDSFLNYAMALEKIKEGNDDEAREIFQSVIEKNPNYTGTYYHLGKLYERQGDKTTAEKIYRNGIQLTFGKELHTHAELQNALNELLYADD